MQLKKLKIEGFGKHKDTEIDFNNLTLFFGLNNAGKTSIKDALYHLITGDCKRQDYINREMKGCTLTGDFGELTIMRRNTPSSMGVGTIEIFNSDGEAIEGLSKPTEKQKYILNYFRCTQDQLEALFYSNNFIERDSESQLNFISQFLQIQITTIQIAGCLNKPLQEPFLKTVGDITGGQELVKQCYDKAFETRRDENRIVKHLAKDVQKGFVSVLPEGVKIEHKKKAEETLSKLETARAKLYEKKGQAKAFNDPEEAERLKESIKENDAFLKKNKYETYESDIKKVEDYKKKYQPAYDAHKKTLEDCQKELRDIEAEVKAFDPIMAELDNFKGKCPVFKDVGVKCPVDPQKARDSIGKKIKAKNVEAKKIRGQIEKVEGIIDGYKMDTLEPRIEKDREMMNKIKSAEEAVFKAEERLAKIGDQEGQDTGDLEKDIEAIEARIEKGRNIVNKIIEEEANSKNWKEMEDKFLLAKKDHTKWDDIVKGLDIEAIKNKLLNAQLVEFRQKIQQSVEGFSNYKVTFDFQKEFQVLVDGFSRKDMGRSMAQSFNIAFQTTLAGYMGIPILIIDDMDMFDYKNATKLSLFFSKLAKKFDSIIAFAAMKTDAVVRPNNQTPFMNVYTIDDGIMQKVGAK